MAVPPIPTPLDHLGQRPFSFYPAIAGIDHNEWILRKATWSEILVSNTSDGREIWIPRSYLGNVSPVDEPVLIVGLTRELEYKAGQLIQRARRLLEMPRQARAEPAGEEVATPLPKSAAGLSREGGAESRVGRLIVLALGGSLLCCILLILYFRTGRDGSRIVYRPVLQSELGLTAADDYHAVVRRLGTPAGDRWRADKGELQYRVLSYPKRGISVILMGTEREKTSYIGAVDGNWKVIDSVPLHRGTSEPLLKSLKRF